MNAVFIFILAVVLPTGEVRISKQAVSECPSNEIVEEFMSTKVASKEILAWGGSCGPIPQVTRL